MNDQQATAIRVVLKQMSDEAAMGITPQFEADQMSRWVAEIEAAMVAA